MVIRIPWAPPDPLSQKFSREVQGEGGKLSVYVFVCSQVLFPATAENSDNGWSMNLLDPGPHSGFKVLKHKCKKELMSTN